MFFLSDCLFMVSCTINLLILQYNVSLSFFSLRSFCRFLAKMATGDAVLKRLEQKGAEADQIIEYLKQQVALLKEKASKKI